MANIPMDGMLIVVMRIAFAEEICIKVTIVRPNVYRIANNRQYFFSPLPFKPFDLSDIDRKQMQRYDIRVQSTENRPAQTSSESEFLFHRIHLFVVSCAHIYHCFRCSIVFNSDASGFCYSSVKWILLKVSPKNFELYPDTYQKSFLGMVKVTADLKSIYRRVGGLANVFIELSYLPCNTLKKSHPINGTK